MSGGDNLDRRPTGEDLYNEICAAAAKRGKSLAAFAAPLFNGASWKIEQMRIARVPKADTIARVRALIADRPLPARKLDPRQQMTRADAEAAGIPPSGRSMYERHLLERQASARSTVDLMMHLSDQARATRRPGQTLQARLNELRREVGE